MVTMTGPRCADDISISDGFVTLRMLLPRIVTGSKYRYALGSGAPILTFFAKNLTGSHNRWVEADWEKDGIFLLRSHYST
jgi:hypothetical protein